jgi:hypothetical protein
VREERKSAMKVRVRASVKPVEGEKERAYADKKIKTINAIQNEHRYMTGTVSRSAECCKSPDLVYPLNLRKSAENLVFERKTCQKMSSKPGLEGLDRSCKPEIN